MLEAEDEDERLLRLTLESVVEDLGLRVQWSFASCGYGLDVQ